MHVRCNQGTFVKFQPQSVDFLEISNPRAVLETTMRHFSCLTEGDVICLPYNDRVCTVLGFMSCYESVSHGVSDSDVTVQLVVLGSRFRMNKLYWHHAWYDVDTRCLSSIVL